MAETTVFDILRRLPKNEFIRLFAEEAERWLGEDVFVKPVTVGYEKLTFRLRGSKYQVWRSRTVIAEYDTDRGDTKKDFVRAGGLVYCNLYKVFE